jgi:hypothetical protein
MRRRGGYRRPMAATSGVGHAVLAVVLVALNLPSPDGVRTAVEDGTADALAWGDTTVDGRRVTGLAGGEAVPLSGDTPVVVGLAVVNNGTETLQVSEVKLTGRVMGMTFFDYGTRIDADLAPGVALERRVELDVDDLSDQGVGLVPTTVSLLDEDGDPLLEGALTGDVQGSLSSAYGIFGLAIAASTAVLFVSLLLSIWRGLLPENRWRRALHFLPVGTGLGLTLTFTLSATRLLAPGAGAWATVVVGLSAAAFALGYFLPQPYDDRELSYEDTAL